MRLIENKLAMLDYYYWLPDEAGRPGCFARNYAGVLANGQCQCVGDRVCGRLRARLCEKT